MSTDVLTGLDAADRARVEGLLVAFDLNWRPDGFADAVADLPADGPVRRAALVEMVKIDLERQWGSGQRPLVEDYLRRFPELAPAAEPLVRAEIAARGHAGAAAPQDEFHRRFPALFSSDAAPTLPAPNPTAVEIVPPTDDLPERFGRYQIQRLLGRGGMGSVYLARDTELDRLVALKVPNLQTGDPESAERFAREARAAATIDHPHVCRVYDIGRIDGRAYLTMAYVEGRTLGDAARETPPDPRRAIEIVSTVARAVAEAHRRGVVHRDLKPGNILMTASGAPVVTDFGLARRESADDPRLTETGMALGTPLYMSPEQMTGDTARVGPASDIYSLGVVLYELLAGRTPFGNTRSELFAGTLTADPVGPSRVRPGVDPVLDDIVLKALAKRPEDRPTMTAFADALDAWLAGRVERRPRSWLWAIVFALAFAGLGLLLLAWALGWLGKGAMATTSRSPTTQQQEERKKSGGPETPTGEPRLISTGSIPAAKDRILAIAFGPEPDTLFTATTDSSYLKVRQWILPEGTERPRKHDSNLHDWAVFTPDGRRVLTGGNGQFVVSNRTGEGKDEQQFNTGPHQLCGAFSRDGGRVILGIEGIMGGYRVRVFETETRRSDRTYAGHPEKIRVVALSDDGKWGVSACAEHFAVREVDGNQLLHQQGPNTIRSAVFLPKGGRFAVGTARGAISLYDVAGPEPVRKFEKGHTEEVRHLTVSETGVLVSGGVDGTVRVWDPETGRERLQALPTGKGAVECIAVSLDGKRIAAGWADRSWRVWELP